MKLPLFAMQGSLCSKEPPVKIRGKILEGMRIAADLTQVPWVKRQFLTKLSIDVYPGTLNLELTEPEDLRIFEVLKAREGIEITPEEPSFCSAKCFPVLIAGQIKGAIILPLVPDYPKNKMELIAPVHVRKVLCLKTGDVLEVEVLTPSSLL